MGFLAGALWQYGDWVFEEFSTDKLAGQSQEEKYAGRCDIAFGVNGQYFWTEAKQCYPTLNGENKSQMVEANLDLANKQVRAGKQRGYKGLAVVFAVPKIKASQTNQRQIDHHISKYIDQLKIIPNITLAWTFPVLTRYLRPGNKWHSHYFPGVIMALLPVKTQKR